MWKLTCGRCGHEVTGPSKAALQCLLMLRWDCECPACDYHGERFTITEPPPSPTPEAA
jgi:hypothetical protein